MTAAGVRRAVVGNELRCRDWPDTVVEAQELMLWLAVLLAVVVLTWLYARSRPAVVVQQPPTPPAHCSGCMCDADAAVVSARRKALKGAAVLLALLPLAACAGGPRPVGPDGELRATVHGKGAPKREAAYTLVLDRPECIYPAVPCRANGVLRTFARVRIAPGVTDCPNVSWELHETGGPKVSESTRASDCVPGEGGGIEPLPIAIGPGNWTLVAIVSVAGRVVAQPTREIEVR